MLISKMYGIYTRYKVNRNMYYITCNCLTVVVTLLWSNTGYLILLISLNILTTTMNQGFNVFQLGICNTCVGTVVINDLKEFGEEKWSSYENFEKGTLPM